MPLLGPRQLHAMGSTDQPPIHHCVRDFGVELQRVAVLVTKRLHREGLTFGQQLTARGQVEAFAMPLIDVIWPLGADFTTGFRRPDRIIADLSMTFRMRIDAAAKMA